MTFELPKETQINETEEFNAFSKDIDFLTEFFILFSELNSGRIHFFSLPNNELYILPTNLIKNSAQTLKSIKMCCSIGSFSDANTLIRKLRDDLMQYIYILNTIKSYKPFIEEKVKNLKTDNPKDFNNRINLRINNTLTDDEQAVKAWFNNTVSDLEMSIRKKLEFENYMKVLKLNVNINQILTEYNLHEYWENLRRRLNNYVHNNGIHFSNHNFISADDKNLKTHLTNINIRTSYVSSFFLIVLLMIESSMISSTDYVDHLEFDMEPTEDSQYLVAHFIQDFIDKKISKIHPELKQYLRDNNIHGMKIE